MPRLKLLHGFHAITARLRAFPATVNEVWYDPARQDARMRAFLHLAASANARLIAARRRAAGLTAAAAKAASGAAETVPYLTVINLARALRALKNAGIQVIGTADDATTSLFDIQLDGALALVMGAEGAGMRRLT